MLLCSPAECSLKKVEINSRVNQKKLGPTN